MLDFVNMDNRKTLVTVTAVVLGAVLIMICSVFASDSVTGGDPSAFTVFIRILVLVVTGGAYAAILLFYGKRNEEFRAKLDEAVKAPLPAPQKKKKKRK